MAVELETSSEVSGKLGRPLSPVGRYQLAGGTYTAFVIHGGWSSPHITVQPCPYIALSTLPNFTLPGDVSASKRYWKEDVIDPAVEVSPQGFIQVHAAPGRGYGIKTDLIEKLTTRKQTMQSVDKTTVMSWSSDPIP